MDQIKVLGAHQYTGENAGEISAFANNLPIEQAKEYIVQDSLKRVFMSVYDEREIMKYRTLVFEKTDWAVKDEGGNIYKMTNEEWANINDVENI